ncbi:MAG TPA: cyclic nucleotide-binding domain-containing protein [Burkholderiaceae bacterium]|nr:cyclic nucleotide-binding domain-containing protein [Burkholderiaceae bacterium]
MPFRLRFRSSRPPAAAADAPASQLGAGAAANASGFGPEPDRWAATTATDGVTLDDVAQRLAQRTLLLPLSLDQARTVAGYMKPLSLPQGQSLLDPLATPPATDLVLIVRGQVRQHTRVQGRALVSDLALDPLGPGDFVSEPALLDGVARNVLLETLSPVVLATLSRGALASLSHDHPDLAARLLSAVCQGLTRQLRTNHRRITEASGAIRDLQDGLLHAARLPHPPSTEPPAR